MAPVPDAVEGEPGDGDLGRRGDEADRGDHPAADHDRGRDPHDPPADPIREPATDAPGRRHRPATGGPAPTPPSPSRSPAWTALGMNAWRTPSSKTPIAAAPAKRSQNRRVRTTRRMLWRPSPLPTGRISWAAETAPGAERLV